MKMENSSIQRTTFASLLLLLATHGEAKAAVVIDNLARTFSASSIFIADTWGHAVSFTTGSTASTVDNATFWLQIRSDANGGDRGAGIQVGIFANSAGSPGSQVGSNFTNPGFGDGSANFDDNYVFTPASTISLSANETYWLKVTSTTDSSHVNSDLFFGNSTTPTTASGFSYNTMKSGSAGGGWSSDFYPYPAFALSVTAVPEPASTTGAVALGLVALAGWARSKKRQR